MEAVNIFLCPADRVRRPWRALCFQVAFPSSAHLPFLIPSIRPSVMLWFPVFIFVSCTDVFLKLCIHSIYVCLQTPIDFQVTRSQVKTTVTIFVKSVSIHYLCHFYRYLLETLQSHYQCCCLSSYTYWSPGQRSRQQWLILWKPFPVLIFVSFTDIFLRLCIHITDVCLQTPIDFEVTRVIGQGCSDLFLLVCLCYPFWQPALIGSPPCTETSYLLLLCF